MFNACTSFHYRDRVRWQRLYHVARRFAIVNQMNMKPRILILMHYMELGGAESALLGLLQSVDPDRADVDVFIYSHRGELMGYLPTEKVRLLDEVEAYSLTEKPLMEVVRKGYLRLALARCIGRWHTGQFCKLSGQSDKPCECAPFFQQRMTWRVLPDIQPDVVYDLAINFMTPHFVLLNRVKAKKKVGWIHTDYTRISIDVARETPMWGGLDRIASISEDVGERFCEVFPDMKGKLVQIENILNASFIRKRADEFDVKWNYEQVDVNLLTIGRYSAPKRMEYIPKICRRLKEAGVAVKWYMIGYGGRDVESAVRANIQQEGVEKNVILLGKKDNPYPYIQACDIYVQPSKYEGKSITVREAQILCKPVVITNYPTAKSQLKDGVDGVIVPLEIEECASAMVRFIHDMDLQGRIVSYLRSHDYGNESEIEKIYDLAR